MQHTSLENSSYLAGSLPGLELIDHWVQQFHADGYLFLPNVLPPPTVEQLRQDLDGLLPPTGKQGASIELHHRMFENSPANLSLFAMEPIVTFAETLIGDTGSAANQANAVCHVIHNNNFRTPIGAGLSTWHQDDPLHYIVTHGSAPTNVRLPVLLFTCNYYLTDVDHVADGPTQVVPRSHLFGANPPHSMEDSDYGQQIVSCLGQAGSLVMFNNQVWHRGAPNTGKRVRYMAQVSYARRLVGHKYAPFMNYVMPEHVYKNADDRLRRLLGFLPNGSYG